MRKVALRVLVIVPLALALAGCADNGSGGEGGESGNGSGAAAQVPAGVAEQYATLEKEIKAEGGETTVGPWRIAYIVEPAEPWFVAEGGQHVHREPAAGETHHIEIIPFEASTGRVVPNVPIRLEIVDAGGTVVEGKPLNFYYGEFFHYANNFTVPKAGTYTLRAALQPPTFLRHGEKGETPALAEGATATFTGVDLKPEK
jgi:Fe2+ transport protein